MAIPPSTVATPVRRPTRGSGKAAAETAATRTAPTSQIRPAISAVSTGSRSAWPASSPVGVRPAMSQRLVTRCRRNPATVPTGNATRR
ncbi:hypothetical protein [Blastococcus brunescens]|uniref:hypothetical protein n=1 Tax=Blastococcus brunescens TaxID=1564165 RepID=UPI003BEF165F